MANINDVEMKIEQFESLRQKLALPKLTMIPLSAISTWESLAKQDWAGSPGVYLFFHKDRLRYVGRALSTTLSSRIFNQINAFGNPAWDEVIKDPKTTIGVIPLQREEFFWSSALESFLIGAFRSDLLNMRIG
jgi:hypothetical protein